MKRLVIGCFICLGVLSVSAQDSTISRLRNKLAMEKSDTARCNILDSLSMYNMFFSNRSDSTLIFCKEYIKTAFPIPDKKYLILAYARAGFYYNNIGQYRESFSFALKGLDLSESNHINDYLSALYYDLSWFYENADNTNESKISAAKGIALLKYNKDPFFDQALHLNGALGSAYEYDGKKDSAEFFYKRVDSISRISAEHAAPVISYYYWVSYYLYTEKEYPKADSVCALGIAACRQYGDFLLNFFYLFSSSSLLKQGKIDQAIAQAREAYVLSLPITDPAAQNFAAGLLHICYEKSGNMDSAYRYLKIKDSVGRILREHINANEIQQSEFDRQISKKEQQAAQVLQQQKDRSRLLLYTFLTVGIVILSFAIFQLRNNRQRKKSQ